MFVYDEVPNQEHSTDTFCAFLLLKALKEKGHETRAVLLLGSKSLIADETTRQRWLDELRLLTPSVDIVSVVDWNNQESLSQLAANKMRRLLWPSIEDFFPYAKMAGEIEERAVRFGSDLIFVWGNWPALAAAHGVHVAPKFAFMGDPPAASASFRMDPPFVNGKGLPLIDRAIETLRLGGLSRVTMRLLRDCDGTAFTSAYHARVMREKGLKAAKYLTNIVPDWGGSDWRALRKGKAPNQKFKILMIGPLETTANLSGVHFFATDVFPFLVKELGDRFETHICGKGKVPAFLSSKLNHPSVIFRGYVDDLVEELASCDVLLVTTPIKLGVRIRIPYAWSVGCCVVSHSANQEGLPEMKDGENALLSSTGEGLAKQISRVFHEPELGTQMGAEGRRTYETHFSYEVTTQKIMDEMESVTMCKGKEK